jgi:hypothetical protein
MITDKTRDTGEGYRLFTSVLFIIRNEGRVKENTYIDGCRCNERLKSKTEGTSHKHWVECVKHVHRNILRCFGFLSVRPGSVSPSMYTTDRLWRKIVVRCVRVLTGGGVGQVLRGKEWICLSVSGCVTHKHLWKLIHYLKKKNVFPFFANPFPNFFLWGSGETRSVVWCPNQTSLHLSSDSSVMEDRIQSLPQELWTWRVGSSRCVQR